ncbi:phage terminase small subunit [Lysinibacillus xylanilyticus]|uniref:phage terminase small subunit n=1 Tax=Lysinibacillus xylanilyticus TaxID=582475 RepID=UPI003CFE2EE4
MKWLQIKEEYETTDITLKALAEKHDIKLGTLKSRKSREKWSRDVTEKDATKTTKVATISSEDATKPDSVEIIQGEPPKKDGRVKKRSGNPNPQNQFTKRNRAAMIHGLRSKFLFDEQVEIMEALQDFDVVDQLWLQIELSFAAIIRAQKIMWVEDPFDHLKEISGEMDAEGMSKTDYKVIYAHERYESYIKAQTRAFAEHRNLVKQFMDLTTEDDERRLKLEQMQLNMEKTKTDIELSKIAIRKENGDDDDEYEDDGFLKAIKGKEVNWDE